MGEVKHMENKELMRSVKFLIFSISAGVIDALSFALCNELFGLPEWISQIIALTLSVLWNFTLNRRYTFQSASNVPIAMLKVAAFYLVFTPASSWAMYYFVDVYHWNEYIVKAVTMVLNFVLEFFYQRYVVFRNSLDTNDLAKEKRG